VFAACAAPGFADTRLFASDAPIAFALTGPFLTLSRTAPSSTNPYPAKLTLTDGAGGPQTFEVVMRARGHSRRSLGYCRFPPILLKFDKKAARGTLFDDQKRLKLTTYCRSDPDYEQRIVVEYLAYRLYNLLTPMSFRVRAAEVTYRTSETDKGVTRFGFLIEDIEDVAERNGRTRSAWNPARPERSTRTMAMRSSKSSGGNPPSGMNPSSFSRAASDRNSV